MVPEAGVAASESVAGAMCASRIVVWCQEQLLQRLGALQELLVAPSAAATAPRRKSFKVWEACWSVVCSRRRYVVPKQKNKFLAALQEPPCGTCCSRSSAQERSVSPAALCGAKSNSCGIQNIAGASCGSKTSSSCSVQKRCSFQDRSRSAPKARSGALQRLRTLQQRCRGRIRSAAASASVPSVQYRRSRHRQ